MSKSVLSFSTRALLFGLACGVSSTAIGGVTLPDESYVLPTEVYVTIERGAFTDMDGGGGSDVYAKVSMAGNVSGYSPIIADDNTPDWDPDYTYALAKFDWFSGFSTSVFIDFYDDDTGAVGGADGYLGRYTANFDFGNDPFNYDGASQEYVLSGGAGGSFVGSVRADSLIVQLTSGRSWNPGLKLMLGDDRQFREVSVFSGGTLTLPGGANIYSGGKLHVQGSGAINANGLRVVGGSLTDAGGGLNLAANTWLIFQAEGQGDLGGDQLYDDGQKLHLESGSDVSIGGKLDVGRFGTGSLVVIGEGTTLTTNTASGSGSFWGLVGTATGTFGDRAHVEMGDLWLSTGSGPTSSSTLSVVSGATFEVGNLNLGTSFRGTGKIVVTGADSVVTQRGGSTLTVGSDLAGSTAVGEIVVEGGGWFVTGRGVTTIKKTGLVNIEGGEFKALGDVKVDGGTLRQSGGRLQVTAGNDLEFSNHGQGEFTGGQVGLFGDTLRVLSGSDVSVWGGLDIGRFSNISGLVVDGLGSTLTTNVTDGAGSSWGVNKPTVIAISNQASVVMQGDLNLSEIGTEAGDIDLDIQSGGTLSVGHMRIGRGNNREVNIEITGAGSKLTQVGSSFFLLGSTLEGSTSKATMLLTHGGRFEGGSGVARINKTGEVIVDGGTFVGRGDVNVVGGSIKYLSGSFEMAGDTELIFSENGFGSFLDSVDFSDGRMLKVMSGSFVSFSPDFRVGGSGEGSVLVDGAGSELRVSAGAVDSFTRFGVGGRSDVVVSHGGRLIINNILGLADLSVAGSESYLDILSGGTLTAKHISLATGMAGSAVVNVDGAGSSITQTGDLIFVVGSQEAGSSSEGTVNISDGGKITAGSRGLDILKTGQVNVNGGGLLIAKSDIDVNGGRLKVDGGQLSFAGYNLNFYEGGQGEFTGGLRLSGGQRLIVYSGSDVVLGGKLEIARNGGAGTLWVDGVGSTVTANEVEGGEMYWGINGAADAVISNGGSVAIFGSLNMSVTGSSPRLSSLEVKTGGKFRIENLALATSNSGRAEIEVSGAGSLVELFDEGVLHVGSSEEGGNSLATINLTDGGRLRTGSGVTRINRTGSLTIDGGVFEVKGDLEVRGGYIGYISGGFSLVADAIVSLSDSAFVSINASTTLNNGRRINVSSGSFLTYAGTLGMGHTTDATVLVSGGRLHTNSSGTGDTSWGRNGGFADVTFEDSGSGLLRSNLDLAGGDVVGSRGDVKIRSGASLNLNDLSMATGLNGNALIEIEGAGSSLIQGHMSMLIVGSEAVGSASVATINLNLGGVFRTGTGGITINKTGTLNIQGGKFDANSDILMNEGTINLSSGVLDFKNKSINSLTPNMNFNFTGGRLQNLNSFGGDLHQEGGVFEVGSGSGNVSRVQGDYVMEDGAVLAFEFDAGKVNGFGTLVVSGDVSFDGELEIVNDGGYVPVAGDAFYLIHSLGMSGAFDFVSLPEIDDSMRYDLIYTADELILQVNTNLVGDVDNDYDVDIDDLNYVKAHFGETFVFGVQGGDANHDGVTDLADLFAVRNNFGASLGESLSIPEPTSVLLLGMGLVMLGKRGV